MTSAAKLDLSRGIATQWVEFGLGALMEVISVE